MMRPRSLTPLRHGALPQLLVAVLVGLLASTSTPVAAQTGDGFDDFDTPGTNPPSTNPPSTTPPSTTPPSTSPTTSPDATTTPPDDVLPTTIQPTSVAFVPTPGNPFGEPPPPPITDTRPPPSAERVAALREMEAELDRLSSAAGVYREAVDAVLNREYQRQRRVRTRWYTQRIDEERAALDEARRSAIEVFEAFIERYPFDATYTPDAMFRLGELYFERSQLRADEGAAAIAAGSTDPNISGEPDYADTIRTYRTLVTRFPSYERLDSALYLIGYCAYYSADLPNGRREARAAWLGISCANRFPYRPDTFGPGEGSRDPLDAAVRTEAARAAAEAASPMVIGTDPMATDGHAPPPSFQNPFTGCTPMQSRNDEGVLGPSEHVGEAWLRAADTYFEEEGLLLGRLGAWLSIYAYRNLLELTDSVHYEGALYKTAWAYFKVAGYIEAVEFFARLLDRVDAVVASGGRVRAGGQLRPEALRFLALSIAYIDWDRMLATADGQAVLALGRLQQYVNQRANWAPEAYFETGTILFEELRYLDAVAVWRYALARWPTNARAPEITEQMRQALHLFNDAEGEADAVDALGHFGEGSAWWTANENHPAEQIEAQELARNALLESALSHHEAAQGRNASCNGDASADPVCHSAARAEYITAVEAYREYLRVYPNDPRAYELHYSLADALLRAGEFAGAAAEFEWVRDSNLDNSHLADAGRGVVDSYRQMLDRATREGRVTERSTPPTADSTGHVSGIIIPPLLLDLARARQTYNARVDELHDRADRRGQYEYDNAVVLFNYGYWELARTRLASIFDERCAGPNANEWGRYAWSALRAIAVSSRDDAAVATLGRTLQERACTFARDGQVVQATREFCARPENAELPQCLSLGDISAIQYREALALFQQAQTSTGPEQRSLYERAATMLVQAVDAHPEDPSAPQALEVAAQALVATSRFESAGRLYQRIIDEVGPRRADDPAAQAQNDVIVANAYFQLAQNANQNFDFDRAIGFYRQLADNERFANSSEERVQSRRRDGVRNAAVLLQRLRRYPEASQYYQRLQTLSDDAELRRNAEFQIAAMAYQGHDYANAQRLFRDFIRHYASDPTAGESVVEAYWNVAECTRNSTRRDDTAYRQNLSDVVTAFRSSGQPPGGAAAYFAAKAAFTLADVDTARVLALNVSIAQPNSAEELLSSFQSAVITARNTVVDPYVERMAEVETFRVHEFWIAARVAEARAYERLIDATRTAIRGVDYHALAISLIRARLTVELQSRGLSAAQIRRVLPQAIQGAEDRGELDDAINELEVSLETQFDNGLAEVTCNVIIRYMTVTRVALAQHIDDASTQYALNRLQVYSQEQVNECAVGEQSRDPQFQPASQGEFVRSNQRPVLGGAGSFPVPQLSTEDR